MQKEVSFPSLIPVRSHIIPIMLSHIISLRFTSILSSYLPLGLPSSLFPSGFPIKILCAFLFIHMCVTCPDSFLLDFLTIPTTYYTTHSQCNHCEWHIGTACRNIIYLLFYVTVHHHYTCNYLYYDTLDFIPEL